MPALRLHPLLAFALAAPMLFAAPRGAAAQQESLTAHPPEESSEAREPGCFSPEIDAITDRPTVSSGTETTQCGVLEVLSGPERIWLGHGLHQDDIAPSLQFGLTPKLDLHYARSTFFGMGGQPGPLAGAGDTFVGARFRLNEQTLTLPSFGLFYTLKVPTGSPADGLGTGRYDHTLALLVSKELPKALHIDFNLAPQLIGRPAATGFDKNTQMILFGYLPPWRRVTLGIGGYGFTALNPETPAYAMSAIALDWHVLPRLILDAGMDNGLTFAAPRKRITFGFSYAPANLYALIAGPRAHVH